VRWESDSGHVCYIHAQIIEDAEPSGVTRSPSAKFWLWWMKRQLSSFCTSCSRECGLFWSFSWIHGSLSGGFCIWQSFHMPAAKAATDDVWNTGSSMSRKRPNRHQPILHWAVPYQEIPPPTTAKWRLVSMHPGGGRHAEESWCASTRRLVQEDTRGSR
jgi:hypothetical protein